MIGQRAEALTYDEILAYAAWANPFLPAVEELTVEPWASPGRVSVAPELSSTDRRTWDEALTRARPTGPRTLPEVLWCHVVAQQRELWPLPDGPFDTPEWIRRQRLRPFSDYAGRINDPALRLPRCL
ncbi:hypothetical protein [Nocardia sp. No.11]|uniref:hypothetical protein n=1 Tax=Nocardia sp. No.11 TaxID=3128861 RepID=UPI00319E940D